MKTQHNEVDLGALLNEPTNHQGEVFTISGAARRILRIEVSDADMQQRSIFFTQLYSRSKVT